MTVSEARAALPDILNRVSAGEEVTITRHGQAVAVLIRPDRLRARRARAVYARAERLRERLADARAKPLAPRGGLSARRGEELLTEVRASRGKR